MISPRKLAVLLLVLSACHDASGTTESKPKQTEQGSAVATGSAGSAAIDTPKPAEKPPEPDESYVPAEFKSGMSRWKDIGVYVDGKPIAFMTFGELPITLKPVWVKDEVSVNKPPGCPECPDRKVAYTRFYRFTDYLKALGIDIKKVKMIHVVGPKLSNTIAATGKDLQSKAADEFMFRFGGLTSGKAIPHTPDNFGNDRSADKISSVMVYIDRKPPTITRDGIELDGVEQLGVPYYGEPLRGGIRIYLDDKLAAIIKRQELDPKLATTTPDGELHWSLAKFLEKNGVDTSKVVEGWVIRDERRQEMIPWQELSTETFTAASQSGKSNQGNVTLGDKKIVVNALALHTRHIDKTELPEIKPDEEY
jgi:hypothetical protein